MEKKIVIGIGFVICNIILLSMVSGTLDHERTGFSTSENDHRHHYKIDVKTGLGETSFNDGHSHKIIDGVVQEAEGHRHILIVNAKLPQSITYADSLRQEFNKLDHEAKKKIVAKGYFSSCWQIQDFCKEKHEGCELCG